MFFRSFIFFLTIVQVINADNLCQTPNNQTGDCRSIFECQSLYKLIERRPITASNADYLRRSQCGFVGAYPKVCCPIGSEEPPTNRPPLVNIRPITSDLLPSTHVCGFSTQQRLFRGGKPDLDEFPWMALVEYEKPGGGRGFHCGGALISKRYVLTAAHCVKGKDLPKTWKLVSVRLGEHDTETEEDCIKSIFGDDCALPPVNIVVEETIVHESYNPNDINQYHDIALLRLKKSAKFTDFVKPICLPTTTEELSKSHLGRKLSIAGWGKTENRSESNIKLTVEVPVKDLADCESTYSTAGVSLSTGQLCAGDEKGRNSCRGDSGGPLMAVSLNEARDVYWYAAGVMSFGPSSCGIQHWPVVYTKVSKYVPWIVSKMKP